jgi:hypothetical protein
MPARRRPRAEPKTPEELKDGSRLVRQVLEAIPPELDDKADAIVRTVIEGYANATDLAAKEAPSGEPSAE